MAAVSSFAQRRKKQATYGKASRSAGAWNVNAFDASDDDELQAPKVGIQRVTTVKETYQVQKRETKPHALKPIKTREKAQDAWGVPSSDEEVGNTITKRSPPKALPKRKLVNAEEPGLAELTPWEKKKTEAPRTQRPGESAWEWRASAAADSQLRSEIAEAVPKKNVLSPGRAVVSPAKDVLGPAEESSSVARLKARKLMAGHVSPTKSDRIPPTDQANRFQKRAENDNVDADPTPRKRLKTADIRESSGRADVVMDDYSLPSCESSSPAPRKIQQTTLQVDVYDFPESNDESSKAQPSWAASPKQTQQQARRGKLKATARSSPKKMESAPARLREMIPMDTDSSDTSRPVTPRKPIDKIANTTPATTFKASGKPTLQRAIPPTRPLEDLSTLTPSNLPMQTLTLQSARRSSANTVVPSRMLAKSRSDLGPSRRRTKLVDRLKASAPSSDVESSDVDDDETEDSEDVQMSSDEPSEQAYIKSSQSHSQTQSISIDTGPKITYGRTRSYLPEDSFEEGLMLGMDVPQQPASSTRRSTAKSKAASQESTFDFDESDEDDTGGKMRSIHELRAGGGNQRFMDETRSLLDDIADHSVSARSRRRSALVEVAKKLKDKTFAEKFFRQGFEQCLSAECEAAPDEIADFVLAGAFATLLSGEPPDHVAGSLRDSGILPWAMRHIDNRLDPGRMAKERRNNMAKLAQSTFVEFAVDIAAQDAIWSELKPVVLTPRNLFLKVIEQVVTRVRRSGDRSDLVAASDIRKIAPSINDVHGLSKKEHTIDVSLSVSVLECLYANAASLSWPVEITERISAVLVTPAITSDKKQYLRFLTQRLCTYLTTDSARNCKAFATLPTVYYLLRAIGEGFLKHYEALEPEEHEINFALLVSDIGVMINLTLHNENAREHAATEETKPLLNNVVNVFQDGQKRMLEAVSEEDTQTNVAYGYLAVLLANLCRNDKAKQLIASQLPGKNLNALIAAMQEFLAHNQKVDMLGSSDEQSIEVEGWSVFTEKLKRILERLMSDAQIGFGVGQV